MGDASFSESGLFTLVGILCGEEKKESMEGCSLVRFLCGTQGSSVKILFLMFILEWVRVGLK